MKTYAIAGLDYLTFRTLTCLALDLILVLLYKKSLRFPRSKSVAPDVGKYYPKNNFTQHVSSRHLNAGTYKFAASEY